MPSYTAYTYWYVCGQDNNVLDRFWWVFGLAGLWG